MSMHDLNVMPLPELYTHLARGQEGLVARLLELARDEDLGPDWERDGDITSRVFVPGYVRATARVAFRAPGVVCGLAALEQLLHTFKADVDHRVLIADGQTAEAGAPVAELDGRLRDILRVERTLLNLVGRLSGIATRTARFVAAARAAGTRVHVLDTRKTSPGLRVLEKYAVRCGGGHSHRLGLYDAVLLKDNHLAGRAGRAADPLSGAALVQAVTHAARQARDEGPREGLRFVELEVDTLDQVRSILEAGGCGVDIVLLDNMDARTLAEAAVMRAALCPRMLLEASGGVTLETIGAIARTGVDRISVGSLTHGATWLDVGLDVV